MNETVSQTPFDQLRQRLVDAPTPLALKDATKGLVKTGKKTPPAPDWAAHLDAEIQAGRLWKYPSGSEGADRYWIKDEKDAIRHAVREAAAEPTPLAALKKIAKDATKADKGFAETVVDEMVTAGQIHEHNGKKPLFGRDKPPPRNDKGKVSEALLAAAATPVKLPDLIKAALAATPSDKDFVSSVAEELITAGRLHKQTEAKTALYGLQKPAPQHPLETGKAKVAFGKLVTDARKLLGLVEGVSASELLDRLRAVLNPQPEQKTNTPPAVEKKPEPATIPLARETAHVPQATTPEAIRSGLKSAYDELRRDVEFQDGLVELGALYHEVKQSLPNLTVEAFHRELLHLQRERAVELQPLNEVQQAKEPQLAIRTGDRLLYFAIWR